MGDVADRLEQARAAYGRREWSAAHEQLARLVEDAWTLATGSDLANPDVEGPRPLSWKLTTAYLERLLPVAHRDPAVAEAFVRVVGMLDRPQQLFRPGLVWRVLTGGSGPRRPLAPRTSTGSTDTPPGHVTEAGRAVVRHRPDRARAAWPRGR